MPRLLDDEPPHPVRGEPIDEFHRRVAAHRRRLEFARRYNLNEIRPRASAIRRVVASAILGGHLENVDRAMRRLGIEHSYNIPNTLFDHYRLFTRPKCGPVLILGSPYGIDPSGWEAIRRLRELGLAVHVSEATRLYTNPATIDVFCWAKGHEPARLAQDVA